MHSINRVCAALAATAAVALGSAPAASATANPSPNSIEPPSGGGGGDWSWYDCIHGYKGHTIPGSEVSDTFDHKSVGYVLLTCENVRHINASHPPYTSNTNPCINAILGNQLTSRYKAKGAGYYAYVIELKWGTLDVRTPRSGQSNSMLTIRPDAYNDYIRGTVIVDEIHKQVVSVYTAGGSGGSSQWNECKKSF